MRKVLVTGANGFIGNAVCRRLRAGGWHVRGTVRSLAHKIELPTALDTVEIGDIGPSTSWKTALEGIDAVVHLAARVHVAVENTLDPITAYRAINVDGTRRLAQMAQTRGVQRFVYLSSLKVNGEGRSDPYTEADQPAPADPYSISKFEAELELQRIADKTDMEIAVLRPPLVYGPLVKANFLQLIKIIDRGIPLPLAGVANKRSLIYSGNLVDALFTCLAHPAAAGKTFLVSDGTDVSTPDLIRKLSIALGKSGRLFPLPAGLLRFLGRLTGKTKAVRKLLESLSIDSSKIRTELNWQPPFTMEEGLKETIDWYLQAYAN